MANFAYDSQNSLQMSLGQRLDFRSSRSAQELHEVPKVQRFAKLTKKEQPTKARHHVCIEGKNKFLSPSAHLLSEKEQS